MNCEINDMQGGEEMGHIRTPKFELQTGKTKDRLLIQGVNTIYEACKLADNAEKDGFLYIYLWGNSGAGKKYIASYPFNADYFKWDNGRWVSVSIINIIKGGK